MDAVLDAGGRPCPPSIVGVGIGGTSDVCVEMAKEALLIPLDSENPDPVLRKMEEDLFVALNSSGLGPMGLGGSTTVLGAATPPVSPSRSTSDAGPHAVHPQGSQTQVSSTHRGWNSEGPQHTSQRGGCQVPQTRGDDIPHRPRHHWT